MDNTTTDRRIGQVIDGRYELTGLIATGGMAAVYEAFDQRLDRTVAVKIISEAHATTEDFLTAFRQEAKTIARLSHPNVVGVYDQGSHEGLPYVVMELVKGITLRDLLNMRRYLSVAEAIEITSQTLEALEAAHSTGLIHRDIKPENILLKDGGRGDRVKVADFGLAEVIQSLGSGDGQGASPDKPLLATAAYVPPELVTYQAARPQSDVYSVGIMLYELLTGEIPFDGEDPGVIAQQHVNQDVPSPKTLRGDVPQPLANLVVSATRRDPAQRPADAGDFGRQLSSIKISNPTTTVPGPRPTQQISAAETTYVPMAERPGAPTSRQTWMKVGIVAAAILLIAGLGWWAGFGQFSEAPSLLNQSEETVEEFAEERGFDVEFNDGEYSDSVDAGQVLSQDPDVGERIRSGGTITVTLSLGADQVTMPNLAGSSEEEARDALGNINVDIDIDNEYSDTVPEGDVISTSPDAGQSVRGGSAVTIVVSEGRAPLNTPEVLGLPEDDAREAITGRELTVGNVEYTYSDTVPAGDVIDQTPDPNSGIGPDDSVDLVVSEGPEPVRVPDVLGEDLEDATEILEEAGFSVDVVTLAGGGEVFSQSSDGGEIVERGSTIFLVVR